MIAPPDKIIRPALGNLSAGTLKQNMPFESLSTDPKRREASYLEAFGRSVGNMNKNSEVDVPLTYADCYFLEALLRLEEMT